ncbi:hypothetical protein JZY91_10655 [Corynebacterium sp. CNCTC7651]|uniref:hypothetical protein n=1 Tax=Corynebacterium sp. CNCTC7651 TaxID=2815361 RepID=UPI001F40B4E4|nr:hypothetical protein [Corynebacterium sp. CNCTC7651]UIZ92103.1 hypothetical protein JZY91_10655 [Corynebacterium sp. CNCTC7651]
MAAIAATRPAAIVLSHSIAGRDIAARIAVRERRALLTDVTGLARDDEGITPTTPSSAATIPPLQPPRTAPR